MLHSQCTEIEPQEFSPNSEKEPINSKGLILISVRSCLSKVCFWARPSYHCSGKTQKAFFSLIPDGIFLLAVVLVWVTSCV